MFVRTPRLLLRQGWIEDAPQLARTIEEAIARNTTRMPWPYPLAAAENWLSRDQHAHAPTCLVFARTAGNPRLIGGVGLHPDKHGHELGYWIARPYWGLGFATEAAGALLRAARESLRIDRIHAGHFADNPASGRVLRKLGFRPTGRTERRFSAARGHDVACLLYAEACEEPAMRCLEAA
ncbi:MAG: GNAT family N-acetyltransferase [Proteobacteria bacterium]|nr:GNAT family N-acetyltransferase [Pseudomonadota bacterium]